MNGSRIGGGLGDSLGLSIKYCSQKVINEILYGQGAHISEADGTVLRELAKRLAEIAALPVQAEKKRLWYKHNDLHGERPMVVCDPENGWYEIITSDQIRCEGDLAKLVEFMLRKEIYWGETMGDDKVIEPIFRTHHVFRETSRGVDKKEVHTEDNNGSYTWIPTIKTIRDIESLKFSEYDIDEKLSEEYHALICDLFDGILDVRQETAWWGSTGMTSDLIFLYGMENMFISMIEEPEMIHALMAFFRDEFLHKFAIIESRGLLCNNNNGQYVGTGGFGFTNQLKTGCPPMLKDIWGLSESQETVSVSPQMVAEFILPYQLELLGKFGLNCYGCCEPLDKRWKYIKDIPNLRRVSVSPWADDAFLAQALGRSFVFSKKPHSAWLASPHADCDFMRAKLEDIFVTARGCNLELIMKDNHTIGNNPQNCLDYVRICRELIQKYY